MKNLTEEEIEKELVKEFKIDQHKREVCGLPLSAFKEDANKKKEFKIKKE